MDLLRKQMDMASAVVTVLVRICGRVFACRRVDGELLIRQLR